ncbi:hypothetical protein CRI94_04355 [Longibacter salinarum]|uniref:MotA/TolQ/ExbB proton channel domain-containing protein n=2 Tax=Longibacter salinarum TaxID=1850348 RepID=A0A2A8D036_9BACT|nr:hypothetical protein CRI94_04355 [Longibacter salinarum]
MVIGIRLHEQAIHRSLPNRSLSGSHPSKCLIFVLANPDSTVATIDIQLVSRQRPMFELLVQGNLTFTVPLVIAALAVVGAAIMAFVHNGESAQWYGELTFQIGLFAFVFGLFSQAISLYQMMGAIERVGAVSPALVAGGLKLSMIGPAMGIGIFAIAVLLRLAARSFSR